MADVKAGTASVVITPPLGIGMAGYIQVRQAREVLDDLLANALVLAIDGERVALLAVDLLAVSAETVARVRAQVALETGIPGAHLLICASHTHTGPSTVSIFNAEPDPEYQPVLERLMAGAVAAAARNLRPAALRVETGADRSFQFNRRTIAPSGQAQMTQDQGGASGDLIVEGPVDPIVGVLRVEEEEDGRPISLLVNYGNHLDIPTGARISADYPGVMAKVVRKVLGEQVVVLFGNGCCGNVEHLNPFDPVDLATRQDRYVDTRGAEKMRRYGTILGAEVIRTAERSVPLPLQGGLRVASETVAVPVRPVDAATADWAQATLDDPDADYRQKAFAREALLVGELAGQSVPVEIQVMAVGDLAVVAIPAEVFVEIGLEIKERSPFAQTFVIELANGWVGYIPTEAAFASGGYETRPARSSKLVPRAATIVTETALALLATVFR